MIFPNRAVVRVGSIPLQGGDCTFCVLDVQYTGTQ